VSHSIQSQYFGPTRDVLIVRINVSFIDKDGEKYDFQVSEGDNLLDIAQANDLEMEGSKRYSTNLSL
jgi:hypothetical protein